MTQITVFSGPERRRRWSAEARLRILNEAFAPGACVSAVARRHDVATGLLYTWRRKFGQELPQPAFAEAVLTEPPLAPSSAAVAAIVVEILVPRLRGDQPAAGKVPWRPARLGRAKLPRHAAVREIRPAASPPSPGFFCDVYEALWLTI